MTARDLSVSDIVGAAFARVFNHVPQVIRVGWLPTLLSSLVGLLTDILSAYRMGVLALIAVMLGQAIMAFFFLAWHRVTLLGFNNATRRTSFRPGARERKFLLYDVGLQAVILLYVYAAFLFVFTWSYAAILAGLLVLCLLFVRIQLIFPAIAVDHPASLARAWRQSSGIFWRLVGIDTLIFVAIAGGFLAAFFVVDILNDLIGVSDLSLHLMIDGKSMVAEHGLRFNAVAALLIEWIFISPVILFGYAVFVSALSYAYRASSDIPIADAPS